jgi:hypothetical protein
MFSRRRIDAEALSRESWMVVLLSMRKQLNQHVPKADQRKMLI